MKILVTLLAPTLCLAQQIETGRDPNAGNGTLKVTPPMIQFADVLGAMAPTSVSVSITSGAVGRRSIPISITVSASTSSGGNWLTVSQSAGATPVTLNVSVNTNGLTAKTYSGMLTITFAAAPNNNPVQVPVELNVSEPTLILQPEAVTFNYQLGGNLPSANTVALSSSGGTLDFTVGTPSVNWLKVDRASGTTPVSINLSITEPGLGTGTFATVLTLTSLSGPQYLSVSLVVRNTPTLIVAPQTLSFVYETGVPQTGSYFSPPVAQRISISGANSNFKASASTAPGTGNWLSIDNSGGTTPSSINVSVQPGTLGAGRYTGLVLISSSTTANSTASVAVTLTVVAVSQPLVTPASLTFETQFESITRQSQAVALVGTGERFDFVATAAGGSWLSVAPNSGMTVPVLDTSNGAIVQYPVPLTVWVDPKGLATGAYHGSITLSPDNGGLPAVIAVTLIVHGNRLRIPQIQDGGSWQTTVILVNTDTQPAPFSLNFYNSDGSPLNVPLQQGNVRLQQGLAATQDTIPTGGSRTLESLGQSAIPVQGWAEVVAEGSIGGTAVLRQQLSDTTASEGSMTLNSATGTHFLLPFDNTQGLSTKITLLNPDTVQATTVTIVFRDENGSPIATKSTPSLSLAAGQEAFFLSTQYSELANSPGVADITSSTVALAAIGLRVKPLGAFTSIEPIDVENAPSIGTTGTIAQIADGGQWQTTMIFVNTGNIPAPFSLQFMHQDGTAWSLPVAGANAATEYSDLLPVGASRILQTNGTAAAQVLGWGRLVTPGSIGGTTIVRQQLTPELDSESSALLNSGSFRSFVLPFDNTQGFVTWVAVANLDPVQSTILSLVLTDVNGQILGNETLKLGPLAQNVFSLPVRFQETRNTRGVTEFYSSNVDLTALGLRYDPQGSFTSVQPLKK